MIGLASCLASPYEIFHIIFIIFFFRMDDRLGRSWEEVLTDLHKNFS